MKKIFIIISLLCSSTLEVYCADLDANLVNKKTSTATQKIKENISQTSKKTADLLFKKGKSAAGELLTLVQNIDVKDSITILRNSILNIQQLVEKFKAENINVKEITKANNKALICLLKKQSIPQCSALCSNKKECIISIYKNSRRALELVIEHLLGVAKTLPGASVPQLSPAALTSFPLALKKGYKPRQTLEKIVSFVGLGIIKIKDLLESLVISLQPLSQGETPIELPSLTIDEDELEDLVIDDEDSNNSLDALYDKGI